MAFGDYIIYVDESGDHGLDRMNPTYPIFVLTFCIFSKEEYCRQVVPTFLSLKFEFFGHDMIVLHSHEIRKSRGPFRVLFDEDIRIGFLGALSSAIAEAPFTVVSSVIDKIALRKRRTLPSNPYEIALLFCMERAYAFLRSVAAHMHPTSVIVEKRGKAEDDALELAFLRIAQGSNRWGRLPFELIFADKKANSTGLQLADLVSYPIGRQFLKPDQPNRSYDVIETKFRRSPAGKIEGWGRKVFP